MDKIKRLYGNELLARFMNKHLQMGVVSDFHDSIPKSIVNIFKYHKSWDWLMRVIIKLDKLSETEQGDVEFDFNYSNWCDGLDEIVTKNYDITETFEYVVEFVEWINKQKQIEQ